MMFLRCFSVLSISSQTHIIRQDRTLLTAEHTLLEPELTDVEIVWLLGNRTVSDSFIHETFDYFK